MNMFYNNKFTSLFLMLFLVFFIGKNGIAQTELTGKITDEDTGEEMIAANIIVTKEGVFVQGETADIDGNYKIRLDPGIYDVEVSYTGYSTKIVKSIEIIEEKETELNIQIKVDGDGGFMVGVGCGGWIIPLIRHDENPTELTKTSEKIKKLPTRNINEIITITPGVSFTQ